MKKTLLWIAAILVAVWAAFWAGSLLMSRTYASREWPEGLGRVEQVPARYPETTMNATASELMRLAAATGIDIGPRYMKDRPPVDPAIMDAVKKDLNEWDGVQLARTTMSIDAAPPAVSAYLTQHQLQLDTVRDHLLRGDSIVWPTNLFLGADAPIPNLLGHMNLTRVLVARSLERSRVADPAAWDELHAAWNLNRGLWKQPTLIEILIALATTRMVNAAAMKAPGQEPAWVAEIRAVDSRRAMLAAHQAEAWMFSKRLESFLDGDHEQKSNPLIGGIKRGLFGTYLTLSTLNSAEQLRRFATEAAAIRQCDLNGEALSKRHAEAIPRWNVLGRISMPNLGGAWQRLMRYQAELETSARAQQMKRGETPASTSRCSDGTWQVTVEAKGTQTVRFSHDIPVPSPGVKYPLEFTMNVGAGL